MSSIPTPTVRIHKLSRPSTFKTPAAVPGE
jgi:hypothetical protein